MPLHTKQGRQRIRAVKSASEEHRLAVMLPKHQPNFNSAAQLRWAAFDFAEGHTLRCLKSQPQIEEGERIKVLGMAEKAGMIQHHGECRLVGSSCAQQWPIFCIFGGMECGDNPHAPA